MARIKIYPKTSFVSSKGIWTIEIKIAPKGIPRGGGVRLLWQNGINFSERNIFSPYSDDFDVRVKTRKSIKFAITMRWLYQMSLGPEITMRTKTEIPGETTMKFIFGEKGRWQTGPYPTIIYLSVYEDIRGDGLFRKIPEMHTLVLKPLGLEKIDVYAEPQINKEGKVRLNLRGRDRLGNQVGFLQKIKNVSVNGSTFKNTDKFLIYPEFNKNNFSKVRIKVKTDKLNLSCFSNPLCKNQEGFNLYFGEIHCHSVFSDGLRDVADAYRYARDDICLDFASVTDHDSHLYGYELRADRWEETKKITEEFNLPNNFVTILGYEWTPKVDRVVAGHHNIYFKSCQNGHLFSSTHPESSTINGFLNCLEKRYNRGEVLVIPHHPVASLNAAGYVEPSLTVAWNSKKSRFLRLVEIYSKIGCSEELNNFRPLRSPAIGHFVIDALRKGYRLGFTGGSDSHITMPGSNRKEWGNLQYASSGIIGVWAKEKTREAIFDALYSRRCYATSGPRSILKFSINGYIMGSEIKLASARKARQILCTVVGTDKIREIQILREGIPIKVFNGKSDYENIQWVDDTKPYSTWYYLRVIQNDGEMLWSSPIWVSYD